MQDPTSDFIVIEAEQYDEKFDSNEVCGGGAPAKWYAGNAAWAQPVGSAPNYMMTNPCPRRSCNAPWSFLKYDIDFSTAGTWKVWIMGNNPSDLSLFTTCQVHNGQNSVWLQIDNLQYAAVRTGEPANDPTTLNWNTQVQGSPYNDEGFQLTVPSAGMHSLYVFPREAGYKVLPCFTACLSFMLWAPSCVQTQIIF